MQPGLIPLLLGGGEQDSAVASRVEHEILFGRITVEPALRGVVVMRRFVYMDEDNEIYWRRMQTRNGTIVNDATVSVVLKTSSGSSVATTSLTYVTDSSGNYEGTLPSTDVDTLTEGSTYYIELTAVYGSYNGFRRIPVEAAYHGWVP